MAIPQGRNEAACLFVEQLTKNSCEKVNRKAVKDFSSYRNPSLHDWLSSLQGEELKKANSLMKCVAELTVFQDLHYLENEAHFVSRTPLASFEVHLNTYEDFKAQEHNSPATSMMISKRILGRDEQGDIEETLRDIFVGLIDGGYGEKNKP